MNSTGCQHPTTVSVPQGQVSRFDLRSPKRIAIGFSSSTTTTSSPFSSLSIVRHPTLIGKTILILLVLLGGSVGNSAEGAAWISRTCTSNVRPTPFSRRTTTTTTPSILPNTCQFHSSLSTRRWAIHLPDSKSQSTSCKSMDSEETNDKSLEETKIVSVAATTRTAAASIDILLNLNAKGVTSSVVQVVESVVTDYHAKNMSTTSSRIRIHTTRTTDQAVQAVQEIVQAKSTLVIPIGGDGTLTALLQLLADQIEPTRQESKQDTTTTTTTTTDPVAPPVPRKLPDIAYIPMGTGNALGSVVGCRPPRTLGRLSRLVKTIFRRPRFLGGTSRKLEHLSETMTTLLGLAETLAQPTNENSTNNNKGLTMVDIVELPLLQVTTKIHPSNTSTNDNDQKTELQESSLCFFAGVGFDSLMLQDYNDLQDWTSSLDQPHRGFFKESLSSVLGYCVALVTRTLPQCLLDQKHLIQVEVSTRQPETTVWIDHRRGDVVRPIAPTTGTTNTTTTLLYRGNAGIVAVGSAPFYGGGLRLFPFARMTPSGMQLRIGRIHPLRGTMNIPQIFAGSYRDTRDDTFGCLDFMGSQFSITILSPSQGYPVQHSGDFIGTTTEVDFAMIPHLLQPVRFVTLLPPRLILEKDN